MLVSFFFSSLLSEHWSGKKIATQLESLRHNRICMHVQMYHHSYTLLCCLMLILCSPEKPKCMCMHCTALLGSASFRSATLCQSIHKLVRQRWNRNENKTKPFDKKIKQLFQQHKYCNNYVCRGMKEFSPACEPLPKRNTRKIVQNVHRSKAGDCVPYRDYYTTYQTIDRLLAKNGNVAERQRKKTRRRHATNLEGFKYFDLVKSPENVMWTCDEKRNNLSCANLRLFQ